MTKLAILRRNTMSPPPTRWKIVARYRKSPAYKREKQPYNTQQKKRTGENERGNSRRNRTSEVS